MPNCAVKRQPSQKLLLGAFSMAKCESATKLIRWILMCFPMHAVWQGYAIWVPFLQGVGFDMSPGDAYSVFSSRKVGMITGVQ